jgi:hypothetical protein
MGTKNDFGGTIARSYEESEDDPKNRGVGLFGLGRGRPITVGALRRLRPHDGGSRTALSRPPAHINGQVRGRKERIANQARTRAAERPITIDVWGRPRAGQACGLSH